MAKILFNTPEDSSGKKEQVKKEETVAEEKKSANSISPDSNQDDFAVFPDWDVVPPNAIINPRLKKKV